ncbi:acyltransferase [Oceanirhabdus sp. W0125-5]|uniref:acyltransferase n=1 Tax=Oceanirhabdus sp. W0125-5 TaxID=2999116 RepID=UPI0022F2FF49|nr:acyltransferase [Oceanirhabdus sp. W0125-5]WBW98953.1 acyltransferase [Oceanirhabdus sp. W0125-5]
MIGKLNKIIKDLYKECKERGLYYFFIMYFSNFLALFRAFFYKSIYFRNITGAAFFLGKRSRFDIFNKKSKINIDKYVYIRKNATIRVDFQCNLSIGEKVFINDNCNINCVRKISIGNLTKIGQNVCIYDHDHNYKKNGSNRLNIGEVIIGKNVWIGSNTVILRNTRIGDNAVIAAGSVVKGEIPENSVFYNKKNNEIFQY